MFLLFEETGKFLTGRLLSETDAAAQVELDSGKRVKVKAANVLLKFEQPTPQVLLAEAQALSQTIELELAWEFAPEGEFGFAELAREYFSAQASLAQQTATLLRLFEAPHYFRRAGKGRFRKAPAEIIAQALAAIEKKKQITLQTEQWASELGQGQCPTPVREQLYKILFKPDKNAPEYKAVVQASRATQLGPLQLLIQAGAIDSPYQFHWRRFLLENFPKGTGFPKCEVPPAPQELPLAPVRAFSIDDSSTTEIDDALSLQGLGSGSVQVGIHIAAPGLLFEPGSALDQIARQRLSTVYMPGHKVTMLPDAVVQACTLQAGQDCPAVSLYVMVDETTLEIKGSQTRLERVPMAANLRYDQLETIVTADWLQASAEAAASAAPALAQQHAQLSFLYRLAQHLKAGRELARGKPEVFNRPDYNFKLSDYDGPAPDGSESVQISVRQRGAPLDLIVAESMILANSSWGGWLAELGVPGLYRSQASMLPGVKVRMGTKALAHAGLGVKSYAWSSSPLRRYTDLVNQWQIIACARHGKMAALAAPFKARDAELFAILSGFDSAYTAYHSFQAAMERFWTLRYLHQQNISELEVTLFKDNLARADTLPLVLAVLGAQSLPRGARLRVKLGQIDEVALDVCATLLARLDQAAEPAALEDDESEEIAGPIAIAVELAESDVVSADPVAAAAAIGKVHQTGDGAP